MGKLVKHNGSMAIEHGGKIYPPMTATIKNRLMTAMAKDGKRTEDFTDPEYLRNLGESGIKIHFLMCQMEWMNEDGFTWMDQDIRTLLNAVPDAVIILRISIVL